MADINEFINAVFRSDKDIDKEVRDMGMDPSTRAVIDSLSKRLTQVQTTGVEDLAYQDTQNQVLSIASRQAGEQRRLQALVNHYASRYKVDMKKYKQPSPSTEEQ